MREFHQAQGRTAKPVVWKIWRRKNVVYTMHGQLGGVMQETPGQVFDGVNIGKSNEKTPEQVAIAWMDRQILLRRRRGFYEIGEDGNPVEVSKTGFDWEMLPENFRVWKPTNSTTAHLDKIIAAKEAIWTRKRDGNQHTMMKDRHGEWQMYSSTLQPSHKDEDGEYVWLDRYPQIKEALDELDVPNGTILSGELVTAFEQDKFGFDVDDMLYVSSIVKSKTELALQKQEEGGWLSFSLFDVIVLGKNEWVTVVQTEKRLAWLNKIVTEVGNPALTHVEMLKKGLIVHSEGTEKIDFDGSRGQAMKLAVELGWEGFVAHDPRGVFKDKGFNFGGKFQRPKYVGKVKPKLEADFIVYWDPDEGIGTRGKGKKSAGVGAVFAYLVRPDGELQYISKVGGGLSEKDVVDFADPDLYPMVWQVEFASWTEAGSLQFPEFVRVRDDKEPEDCTTEQIPKEIRDSLGL